MDEEETIESIDEIRHPFDPTKIRVERSNPTVDLLTTRMLHEEINLSPDFQRKAGIWTEEAQSRLIESILIRIPLPAFYVDATDDDLWLVVDGLQRLTTLKRFIVDKTLKLSGLEFLQDLEGFGFDDLPRSYQRRIEETEITIFAIQAGTPEEVKFNIFKRINTGGLPLSAQEIRNALNGDRVRQFLVELARSREFLSATRSSIRDKRMADRECITRYIAFCRIAPQKYTSNDFDAFLNKTMRELNDPEQVSDSELEDLRRKFLRAMRMSEELWGKWAFRKYYGSNYRLTPINKALFESWAVNLTKLSESDFGVLLKNQKNLESRYVKLIGTEDFSKSISQGTGSPSRVRTRFESIERLIRETIENA